MSRRILVTGSRKWTDRERIRMALLWAWCELGCEPDCVLVHGDCPTGADALAAEIWSLAHLPVEAHPADWENLKRAAGPIRNQEMVNLGADLCLAFPLPESRGTFDCMKRAERAGIPVRQLGLNAVSHAKSGD